MGPWLGVVQWAEVILHWQGPKSNDLWWFMHQLDLPKMKPSRFSKYSRGWGKTDCRWWAERSYKRRRPPQQGERMTVGHNLIQLSPYRSGKAWLWKCWRVECTIASSMSFCASNLHGPLKAGLFADLSWVVVIIWYALGGINMYKHHLQTVDTCWYAILCNFHIFSPSLVISWGSNTRIIHVARSFQAQFSPKVATQLSSTPAEKTFSRPQRRAPAAWGPLVMWHDVTWRLPSGKLT